MRHGIHVAIRHPHEAAHLEPLRQRLLDVRAGTPSVAEIVVMASSEPPVKGAWNVQVFHGLGDKNYTLNPIFLQRWRFPRLRTAMNMAFRALRLPANFLSAPARPGRRAGRYDQVNAYGPYFHDRLSAMLKGTEVTGFGHPVLNDLQRIQPDPEGPLLWLPTWDNRKYMGGRAQSSLAPFAHEVALASRDVPVRVKLHPLTLAFDQDVAARAELAKEPGVAMVDADADPYALLQGVRGVLTDSSSIGFEAYCLGLPVGIARPKDVRYEGLHRMLADRVPVFSSGRPDLLNWAQAPTVERDKAFISDILYPPSPARNDAFAADLRLRMQSKQV